MSVDLVGESIKFMILGMGVVFLFLFVLVQMMRLQAYLIDRYFPAQRDESSSVSGSALAEEERRRVAAVIAAIAEFRKAQSTK